MTPEKVASFCAQTTLGALAVMDSIQSVLGCCLLAVTLASASIECYTKLRQWRGVVSRRRVRR